LSSPQKDSSLPGEREIRTTSREAPKPTEHDTRLSPRFVKLSLLAAALVLLAIIVGVQAFDVDKIPVLTEEALEAASERWHKDGPASYDLDVQIGGAQPGVAHVEVRNGVVTAASRDGVPTPKWTWEEWSVPGQFEMLEREFEFAADPQREMQAPPGAKLWLHGEFDPKYGYPRRYHRYATGGAPEVYWRTTMFKPM
jgi:hypothetical protein